MTQNDDAPAAAAPATFTAQERDEFYLHYAVCALWSSLDEAGEPLDARAGLEDILADTEQQMRGDCNDFIDANQANLTRIIEKGLGIEHLGHDFWLTRNGHGAGFWDRGLGKLGDELSAAAKVYGSFDLYIDEDGKVGKM